MEDWLKDGGHGLLKNGRGSFETKRKDCPLVMGIWNTKSSFVSFGGVNAKLPKTGLEHF